MFPLKHMASFRGLFQILVVLTYTTKDAVFADSERTSAETNLDKSQNMHVLHKRAPGWGKRNLNYLVGDDDLNSDLSWKVDDSLPDPEWDKRAPGWGKRDTSELDKRAPGWGKRAPGWGKRAPGWGKREPGWGKRAPGWGKREPGWGKRAPGWGKREPGWGKRSTDSTCKDLNKKLDTYLYEAVKVEARRMVECGNISKRK